MKVPKNDVRPLFVKKVCVPIFVALVVVVLAPAHADEVGDAIDASLAAQRAARESQQRVDKLDAETRALREKRRAAEWRALQLAAYAEQLEQEAKVQEQQRAGVEAELRQVASTGTDLLPLTQRMLAELEAHVARDLPFLQEVRRKRIDDAKALLADPQRSQAEKFRRVLEAWRSEVEYGYSIGAEDVSTDCAGQSGASTQVRIGRVGLYCLASDGRQAARWDAAARRWVALDDDDEVAEVAKAAAMAREKLPAEVLVLPVARGAPP
jgi:Protein of unknown function (DUF3450)